MRPAPRKDLGQHFLVDENILRVIERLAELSPTDVVLEIGPGLGVLTRFLAERVAHVHAAEVNRRLEEHLAAIARTSLHWGDALDLDVSSLDPPPHKLVANLPYNVATPIVAESLALAQLELWCVMVQREVADRFFARPSTKAYGAVSVLVQLAAQRTGFHPVSREVFRPRPNVNSALVAFRRSGPGANAQIRRVVVAAFAHRRKTLANALALAGLASREHAVDALAAIGRDPGVRAEALEPAEFVSLTEALGVIAPAKLNFALVVGPLRADGKHELTTVYQALELGDDIEVERAGETTVEGFDDTIVRNALALLGGEWRVRIEKHIPVAAGLGGGSSDAAAALRLANGMLDRPLSDGELRTLASRVGADVPFFLRNGPQLGTGDGTTLEPLGLPQDYAVLLLLPAGRRKRSTADVYSAFDARGGAAGYDERTAALREALAAVDEARDLAALPPNDLASSPLADRLRAEGAFRADVSGAGPAVYGLFDRAEDAERARAGLSGLGETWITRPSWYR